MSTFRFAVAAVVLSLASLAAAAQDKVVYHVNDTQSQALATLRNIRNHLDTDPTAQITVVTHAFGVDFLLEGMKDRNETSFDATVAALKNLEEPEQVAKRRGLSVEDVTPAALLRAREEANH